MKGFYVLHNGALLLGYDLLDQLYILGCEMIRKKHTRRHAKFANFTVSLTNKWEERRIASGASGLKFVAMIESTSLPKPAECTFLIHPETLASEDMIREKKHSWTTA